MNVELTRFKVKQDKSHRVDEWMQLLNDNMKEVLLTLNDEKMYVETIFREIRDGEEYLYWYSVQGKLGLLSKILIMKLIKSTWNFGMSVLMKKHPLLI